MNKLHSVDATFTTERVDDNTVKVTIRTQDGVKTDYYGNSVDSCYAQFNQDRDNGMLGEDQAR